MGRRSRKRGLEPGPADHDPAGDRAAPPRPAAAERPRAPWHPFPLVELSALAGIVLLVLGFLQADQARGRVMIVAGMALGSLAGLDTALRDHFAGHRSHSTLLAALPAALLAGALFFAELPAFLVILVPVAVFAGAFVALRRAFERRAGVAFR